MRVELALLATLLAPAWQAPGAGARVVFSADTEGCLRACPTCSDAATPGLARRATVLAELRGRHEIVLADAGNALHGRQSAASEGRDVVRAYERLRYDVVHLAVRDLLPSAARTRAVLAAGRVPFVTSNLVDANGDPLASPWLVATRGGTTFGFLGVSEPPAPDSALATLLGDQRVVDPTTALARWLPEVGARATSVLVLCAGSPEWADRLRVTLRGRVTAVLAATASSVPLAADGEPCLVGAAARGRTLTELAFADSGNSRVCIVTPVAVPHSLAEDPDLLAALSGTGPDPAQDAPMTRPSERPVLRLPLTSGTNLRAELSATTDRLALRLHGARVTAKYASRNADEGTLLLVLDAELENLRDIESARKDESLDLAFDDLGALLRIAVDGDELRELVPDAEGLPGHLQVHDLRLPFRGRPVRGNLVFSVPVSAARSLELRLIGATVGAANLLLAGAKTQKPAEPEKPRSPLGLAGVGLTPEQVNAAIARGAEFLWDKQRAFEPRTVAEQALGAHTPHLLVALALVHAGTPAKNPECLAYLRDLLRRLRPAHFDVYQAGLLCMLVESLGDPEFLPLCRTAARFLVEGQGKNGTWTYTANVPSDLLRDFDQRVLQVTGGLPLDATPRDLLACERTRELADAENGDLSCTQFALLGLRSASRLGVQIPQDTWKRIRTTVLARQTVEGGFGYEGKPVESITGSMTLAGICILAITAHELGLDKTVDDLAFARALGWLDPRFEIGANPNGGYASYWRYGIERTGRILGRDFLGRHEWYPIGARFLVDSQQSDGSWPGVSEEVLQDTAFAVLFLTRATATLDIELAHGGAGTLVTGVHATPPARFYVILDASGSMLDKIGDATKFDTARDALLSLVAMLPDECELALRVYGHRKRAIDPAADEDSELVIPMAQLERAKFAATLAGLRARGKTPLAFSIEQATADLGSAEPDKPTTLLLLTDGGEDPQSKRDPRIAAQSLAASAKPTFHVIGFDIQRPDWSKQLLEVSKRGNGTYWPATQRQELERGLRGTLLRQPEAFVIENAKGEPVARGAFGATLKLPEGRYRLVTEYAGRSLGTEFWINTDAQTSVIFDGSKLGAR